MNAIERLLAQAGPDKQTRVSAETSAANNEAMKGKLMQATKDFFTGVLRGNTTDFLNMVEKAKNQHALPPVMEVILRGQEAVSNVVAPTKKTDAEPVPEAQRPIGDVVLEKITGIKKGNSAAEEAGTLVSVGGLVKKAAGAAAGVATAMIVPAAKVGRPQLYEKAVQMVRENPKISNEELFQKTGTYFDDDGQLKAFMSDSDAKLLKVPEGRGGTYPLSEILDHPRLFEAYPDLKNTQVRGDLLRPSNSGSYDYSPYTKTEIITTSASTPTYMEAHKDLPAGKKMVTDVRSVILHEAQHAIQRREGYTRGANPAMFRELDPVAIQEKLNRARATGDQSQIDAANRFAKKATEAVRADAQRAHAKYENVPGEQEARFTQFTEDLNDVQGNSQVLKLIKAGQTPQTWDTQSIPTTKKD